MKEKLKSVNMLSDLSVPVNITN